MADDVSDVFFSNNKHAPRTRAHTHTRACAGHQSGFLVLKQWMLAEIERIADPDSATSAVSAFWVAQEMHFAMQKVLDLNHTKEQWPLHPATPSFKAFAQALGLAFIYV